MPSKNIQSPSASRRILVILALIIFIVALALVIISSLSSVIGKGLFGGYAEGYKAAREQAYALGFRKMPNSIISGKVKSIGNGEMIVTTNLFVDKRVDGVGQDRTIKVGNDTKITKTEFKDQEKFREEQRAFYESTKDLKIGEFHTPPSPTKETEVKLSDLSVGSEVTIYVSGTQDLTLINPIQAQSIQVIGK